MPGLLINGVRYIRLCNDNDFKKKSLYDNVYFTLRDIFANAESSDTFMEANTFNGCLTGGVCFEDRTERFQYSNRLHEKFFVGKLQSWLKHFKKEGWFEFDDPEDETDIICKNHYIEIDEVKYMKFDDWWIQFEELRNLIKEQYEKCCMWEEEDIDRDMDRLAELSDKEN